MAKIDLERRAEIGRERRARTRAQILEAGASLLAEKPPEGITIDALVEAAGVAKGTFYYHFESIDELAAAVGACLSESFDELLSPDRMKLKDPVERLSFAFTQFLDKASADTGWARLVVKSAQSSPEFGRGIRANLKADMAEALAQRRIAVQDLDLAVDVVMGIWLQVTRGVLERGTRPGLTRQAVEAVLAALGVTETTVSAKAGSGRGGSSK
ncbi:TetR/AcrR family transcriptional regulator [Mesorhizobium sp. M1E.F.Ca.ET.063.01.1.1]|uniref:TetR/AcrR family transcriptional regulator n=1 Tax=Mesorhizobium sp. M1E.F.Ca.ET.063.01.1.1 TaxID=2496750 RepID=UPI000FCBD008|nr:TetR/AcrR family transcriptional regulator [Mesorhizobium sp. M1E.F.Ca.ET.063.01.1.1]RUW86112.1 TetR/AcrR family transcriptional regulator [Mesorhizobium sp. M1E.F.Ca.ET.063.01.1.1]